MQQANHPKSHAGGAGESLKPANLFDLQNVEVGQADVDNMHDTLKICIAAIPEKAASSKEIADILVILDTEYGKVLSGASNDKAQMNWATSEATALWSARSYNRRRWRRARDVAHSKKFGEFMRLMTGGQSSPSESKSASSPPQKRRRRSPSLDEEQDEEKKTGEEKDEDKKTDEE